MLTCNTFLGRDELVVSALRQKENALLQQLQQAKDAAIAYEKSAGERSVHFIVAFLCMKFTLNKARPKANSKRRKALVLSFVSIVCIVIVLSSLFWLATPVRVLRFFKINSTLV